MANPKFERKLTAAENSRRAKYRRKRYRDNRELSTRRTVIGMPGKCWCGEPWGHLRESILAWRRNEEGGAPHPR